MKQVHKIYASPTEPEKYPFYTQRNAKAVTRSQLGNRIRFMTLRWFDTDDNGKLLNIKEAFKRYTEEFDLGSVMWPMYPTLLAENFHEVVEEAAQRGMFMMDFGGYVPGSNPEPGSIWGEFQPPSDRVEFLEQTLGNHFMGFANGEQDGRYIGGYSQMMCPAGCDRKALYDNFRSHFDKFEEHMRNSLLLLSSLNFPHYFAQRGNTVILGAETAQALPCANMWYSYIRGAGKQYGLVWFGNASIWNRWGWKDYDKQDAGPEYDEEVGGNLTSNDLEHGPYCGTSLSLLKRLLYTEYMYNSDMLGFEASWFLEGENRLIDDRFVVKGSDAVLSPIGIMQQSMKKFVDKYNYPGVMHTPVCIYLDFFNGFVPPRHLYSKDIYKVWGNNPYRLGDYQLHSLFSMIYPDYEDAGFFRDERGFLTSTPYGDIADVIFSDASSQVLDMYNVVLAFGEGDLSFEAYDKFMRYVKNGGHGVICCDKILKSNFTKYIGEYPNELGIQKILDKESYEGDVVYNDSNFFERKFDLYNVVLNSDAQVVVRTADGRPLIIRTKCGEGIVSVICSNAGIRLADSCKNDYSKANRDNKKIAQPYEFLTCVEKYLGDIFSSLNFIKINNPALQYSINTVSENEFNILVCNNTYSLETFDIIGDSISEIEERSTEDVARETPGFTPQDKYCSKGLGSNKIDGEYSIEPLDVKVFNVKTSDDIVERKPEVSLPVRNEKLYVAMTGNSIQEFCVHNPSAINYFNGVKVDAAYFDRLDIEHARTEAEYLTRFKTDIIVDFSNVINHYPGLSFIRNIEGRTEESVSFIKNVFEKAFLYNCGKVIITLHRNAENMVTIDEAYKRVSQTLSEITELAKNYGITVYLQNGKALETMTVFSATEKIYPFISGNEDIKYAYNICHSLGAGEDIVSTIKNRMPAALCISAPEKDIFGQFSDAHIPVSLSSYKDMTGQLLKNADAYDFICLDAVYQDFDEIYSDFRLLDTLTEC